MLDCLVMDEQELLTAVHSLVALDQRDLVCGQAGHSTGHMCLMADDGMDVPAFGKVLSGRYGRLRNLAMDGYADPTSH
ncbi:hypothetical protein ACWGI8_15915 [Streptomyces sp. NPDC054841]